MSLTAIAYLLNPGGRKTVTRLRRRPNKGTPIGVRKSWITRKAKYGDSGDSAAVKVLHGLGVTGLGVQRARGAVKTRAAATARTRIKRLPAYWQRLLAPKPKAKAKPKRAAKRGNPSSARKQRRAKQTMAARLGMRARRARQGETRSAHLDWAARSVKSSRVRYSRPNTGTRRKNAFFSNTERHSKDALVKWGPKYWPNITLYDFIKKYGVYGGQQAYARYCREHGISPRRRGKWSASASQKEMEMARTRRRKSAGRKRSRRSASAPIRRRRRRNPVRKAVRRRRSRKVAAAPKRRRRRRSNPAILFQPNPTKRRRRRRSRKAAAAPKRRRRRRASVAAPKRRRRRKSVGKRRMSRRRRRNAPILFQPNPFRKTRKSRRRSRKGGGRRRSFRRNPVGSIFDRLKAAIPTLDDVINVAILTGTGLVNEFFGCKLFDKIGLSEVYKTVPYADHMILTVLETVGASFISRRVAQMVMYGGLSTLLRSVLAREVFAKGLAGTFMQTAAKDVGYSLSDYVTYGGPAASGLPNRMSDFVTLGDSEEYGALDCSPGNMESEALADYYGVTAF